MKSNKRSSTRDTVRPAPAGEARTPWWYYALAMAAALAVLLEVYGPALGGPFLFDDRYLPFFNPAWAARTLIHWITGVRPLLMFTYWLNFQLAETQPYGYHMLNVLFHFANGVAVWLIVERLLAMAGVEKAARRTLSIFSAAVFLFHPLQTESVAYIASRSENLTGLLFNTAFAVFLYRRKETVSVGVTAAVVVLFALACTS
jgi:protein O-mannosyl-transferase